MSSFARGAGDRCKVLMRHPRGAEIAQEGKSLRERDAARPGGSDFWRLSCAH